MDSMLVFILHAKTASAVSLPTVDLQVGLIGTTFGIVDLPVDELHALGVKEAKTHAKEVKTHASELLQMEAHASEPIEKGAQASKAIVEGALYMSNCFEDNRDFSIEMMS